MKSDELLIQLAALITIGAAVYFVLNEIMKGKDCCSACSKKSAAPAKKGFGGGGGGGDKAAPPRKSACG